MGERQVEDEAFVFGSAATPSELEELLTHAVAVAGACELRQALAAR